MSEHVSTLHRQHLLNELDTPESRSERPLPTVAISTTITININITTNITAATVITTATATATATAATAAATITTTTATTVSPPPAFRPCYIRAYNDAKDIMDDDGTKLEGTKSTADDFVSKGEFRMLNAYLCVYAAMYDAFAKVDGGGAGRDAGDDLRIELAEWMGGYAQATGYGFVALSSIKSDSAAKEAFQKMDDNGGGIVLLDEWCVRPSVRPYVCPCGRMCVCLTELPPSQASECRGR